MMVWLDSLVLSVSEVRGSTPSHCTINHGQVVHTLQPVDVMPQFGGPANYITKSKIQVLVDFLPDSKQASKSCGILTLHRELEELT